MISAYENRDELPVPRPTDKTKNKVEFLRHWKSHADNLLAAGMTGAHIHKSGNIAQSGKLLEKAVRKLFKESIAPTHKVIPGYFYSGDMTRSAQIDMMLCETSELYMLNQDAKSIQGFAPFTSVSVVCQIKNSASQIKSALDQISSANESWAQMRYDPIAQLAGESTYKEAPLTCVIIARANEKELATVRRAIKTHKRTQPTYTLVLEQGVIIGPKPNLLFDDDDRADFYGYRQGGTGYVLRPPVGADCPQGRALLWLYFAIVSKLVFDEGNRSRFKPFLMSISRSFPLHFAEPL